MSEFQLAYDQLANQRPAQHQGHSSQVEWYSSGANFSAANDFNYEAPTSSAGAHGTFEEEESLLQELDIDIPAILRRSRGILLNRLGANEMLSLDLGGPLFFALLLASAHLLVGKLHFGAILGWNAVASLVVWFVVNNIGGIESQSQGLGLYECCCLLGYCQVPILMHAFLALLLPRGTWNVGIAVAAVGWAAWTASKLFTYRSKSLKEHFYLILYPCLLTYTAFALLTLY